MVKTCTLGFQPGLQIQQCEVSGPHVHTTVSILNGRPEKPWFACETTCLFLWKMFMQMNHGTLRHSRIHEYV